MAIGAFVTLTPKPGAAAELLERTIDVIRDVRAEPGCLASMVLRDPEDPDRVLLFEIYRDQAAIAAHKQAAHTIEKGPALQALLGEPLHTRWFETIGWPDESKPE
jgi:autoinducer 2-degrading protein